MVYCSEFSQAIHGTGADYDIIGPGYKAQLADIDMDAMLHLSSTENDREITWHAWLYHIQNGYNMPSRTNLVKSTYQTHRL